MHKAIIVKPKIVPHPNADRLNIAHVCGETVVVGKNIQDGDLCLYFNCELQLSNEFASANNLVRVKHEDGTTTGYFDPNRRVRIQKLRGVKSHGFICELDYLSSFGDISKLKEGDTLDSFNGKPICCKYLSKRNPRKAGGKPMPARKKEICFPEHLDTQQLKYNLKDIKTGDELILTLKVHGCVHYDTLIDTDQGVKKIGEIVDKKIDCKILARDLEEQEDVYVYIDDFYKVSNDGEWYEIEFEDGRTLTITGNNPVWLPEENIYRRVDELVIGDICLAE